MILSHGRIIHVSTWIFDLRRNISVYPGLTDPLTSFITANYNKVYFLKGMTLSNAQKINKVTIFSIIIEKELDFCILRWLKGNFDHIHNTADMDLLKIVPVEILLNFGNYFRTFKLGFSKFPSGIVFLPY